MNNKIKALNDLDFKFKFSNISIFSGIKRFFGNIIRIFVYIPIIWNDRDWDQHFFLNLMLFKLGRMEKYFRNADIIVDSEKCADEIKIAINLLEKIIEDNWYKDEWDILRQKYPNMQSSDESQNEYKKYFNKCDNEKEKCHDEFFSYLKNNYEKWWD